MAGHPDFVSKTSNDLVSRGLRNIHRIHREGCSICELEQLINCEKQSVTQRKRIEILESIAIHTKRLYFGWTIIIGTPFMIRCIYIWIPLVSIWMCHRDVHT